MEEEYKIFKNNFNKALDLVSNVDPELEKKYKQIVRRFPRDLIYKISTEEFFHTPLDNDDYYAEMDTFNRQVVLDYTRYDNYLRVEIEVGRYFPQQLYTEILEGPIKVFNLRYRNQRIKQPELRLFYEVREGKIFYTGNNDKADHNYVEVEYDVFLEKNGVDFMLTSRKTVRGWLIYEKKYLVYLDELIHCAELEEDYKDDDEVEFDADFDLPND